jgi:hypothetical protein
MCLPHGSNPCAQDMDGPNINTGKKLSKIRLVPGSFQEFGTNDHIHYQRFLQEQIELKAQK